MMLIGLLLIFCFPTATNGQASKQSVIKALTDIENDLSGMNEDVSKTVERSAQLVKDEVLKVQTTLDYTTMQTSLVKIGASLHKFKSSDPLQKVSGALDILGACTAVIPKYGPIISGVFYFASSVVGLFGNAKSQKGIGEVVLDSINDALQHYDDQSLRAEAFALTYEFSISQVFLNNMIFANLTSTELTSLSCHVPIYRGSRFFGLLEYKIDLNKNISNSMASPAKALNYILLYTTLAVSRQTILQQLCTISNSSGQTQSIANGINSTIKIVKDMESNLFKVLMSPHPENAVLVSYFVPSKYQIVQQFLESRDLTIQPSLILHFPFVPCCNGKMESEIYPHEYIGIVKHTFDDGFVGAVAEKISDGFGRFQFTKYGEWDDNYYTIKLNPSQRSEDVPSDIKYTYIIANDNSNELDFTKKKPGDNGVWKAIRVNYNNHQSVMMYSKLWPDLYMCVTNDTEKKIKLCKGNPEKNAFFKWIQRDCETPCI